MLSERPHPIVLLGFAILVAFAPDAMAYGPGMDPDGASLWQQLVDWFADAGMDIDPFG